MLFRRCCWRVCHLRYAKQLNDRCCPLFRSIATRMLGCASDIGRIFISLCTTPRVNDVGIALTRIAFRYHAQNITIWPIFFEIFYTSMLRRFPWILIFQSKEVRLADSRDVARLVYRGSRRASLSGICLSDSVNCLTTYCNVIHGIRNFFRMDKIQAVRSKLSILYAELSELLKVPDPGELHIPLALLASIPAPPSLLVYPNSLPTEYEINTLMRSKLPVEFDLKLDFSESDKLGFENDAECISDVLNEFEFEEFKQTEEFREGLGSNRSYLHLLKWMASGE